MSAQRPWRRLSLTSAARFLDLAAAAGGDRGGHWQQVAAQQLEGAVALHNRLVDQRIVWLGDEVGMGKTFVALAVAALVRHEHPNARLLFLLPSSRLQPKWRRELSRFTGHCVRVLDHRARTLQGRPARPLVEPRSLKALAQALITDPDQDALAPLSAFSLHLPHAEEGERRPRKWMSAWEDLHWLAPRLPERPRKRWYLTDGRPDKTRFKRLYAAALNAMLPTFDLVICDESHNLRAGIWGAAARNITVAAALGGVASGLPEDWEELVAPLRPRVQRLLCLTATPVERSFSELAGQASVFGFPRSLEHGEASYCPPTTGTDLRSLRSDGNRAEDRKETARRFVIRRLHQVRIGEEEKTKNQYRREWRQGGMSAFDDRLDVASPIERLTVALFQKKVLEVLHRTGSRPSDGHFLPSFQIGMLSSFESFGESIDRQIAAEVQGPVFEGVDQRDRGQSRGKDTATVDVISRDFRRTFGRTPPHPKLNHVARELGRRALAGDKSLVFVRRVRTTEELAQKVAEVIDEGLTRMLLSEVDPRARADLDKAVEGYLDERRVARERAVAESGGDDADTGASTSFFSWYFRGTGTAPGLRQQGAALRRRTLQTPRHPWYPLLHDNHVLWLFDDDLDALQRWIVAHEIALEQEVRRVVGYSRTTGKDLDSKGVGAGHWYEAWQAAALELHGRQDHTLSPIAAWLRRQLYPGERRHPWTDPIVPATQELLRQPLFARLRTNNPLQSDLWRIGHLRPDPTDPSDWKRQLRERELRRELVTALLRLGRPCVDLWLALVSATGSVHPPGEAEARATYDAAVDALIARLQAQSLLPETSLTSWHELRALCDQFHVIVGQNFPHAHRVELYQLSRTLQAGLARQSPVVALHGESRSEQALVQFRMPGYPLVMVATDVVREGVDLHTFCKRVVHYGIAGSSAGTEQRTGRVDRLDSLAHRTVTLDDPDTMLQVHFPHLHDTVEPLQARLLYERMNRFMRMVHDGLGTVDRENPEVDIVREIHQEHTYPKPYTDRLQTSFAVRKEPGPLGPSDLDGADLSVVHTDHTRWLQAVEAGLRRIDPACTPREDISGVWLGELWLDSEALSNSPVPACRRQPYRAELRSRRDGEGVFLRLQSPIGEVPLRHKRDRRRLWQRARARPGIALVEEHRDRGASFVAARMDIVLIHPSSLADQLARCLYTLLHTADDLEQHCIPGDQDLSQEQWV